MSRRLERDSVEITVEVDDDAPRLALGGQKPAVQLQAVTGRKPDVLIGEVELVRVVVGFLVRVVELAVESHELQVSDDDERGADAQRPLDAAPPRLPRRASVIRTLHVGSP